tara:strand:- start:517 stop:870 length:354 start_codon:yes stop_codon:yes gene_type:complete
MALNLSKSKTYTWPVEYEYPEDGEYKTVEFIAKFKRMPQSYLVKIGKLGERNEIEDTEVVKEVLAGWSQITELDKDGNEVEVPFNKKNLETLLEMPMLSAAILIAFFKGVQGSKVKN